ncbi:MAG: PhoH family protein [Pseudomonadota bacterium]
MDRDDMSADSLTPTDTTAAPCLTIDFARDELIPPLFGDYDQNLALIEQRLGVRIAGRGARVVIDGPPSACHRAEDVLQELYDRLAQGFEVEIGDVEGAIRMANTLAPGISELPHLDMPSNSRRGEDHPRREPKPLDAKPSKPSVAMKGKSKDQRGANAPVISSRKKTLMPRSPGQSVYMRALASSEMVFAVGPAGTGKTYLAVAKAVAALEAGEVDRIILSRPAVEAGESLGFLPGDMKEKVDPYLRPLYDALYDMMASQQVEKAINSGVIEIAPLAFMRGRTLSNAYVILDEAQNTSIMQMKMFLTRFGQNSRMVVCGDPSQVDLPPKITSGLRHALGVLSDILGISVVRFGTEDVVRHALVGRIVSAYASDDGSGPRP